MIIQGVRRFFARNTPSSPLFMHNAKTNRSSFQATWKSYVSTTIPALKTGGTPPARNVLSSSMAMGEGGSALLLTAAAVLYLQQLQQQQQQQTPTVTSCDFSMAATQHRQSAGFKVCAALEAKEEMQKIRLARFLHDIHELAMSQKKNQLQRRASEHSKLQRRLSTYHDPSIADNLVSLHGMDLQNLSPEKAWSVIKAMKNGKSLDKRSLLHLATTARDLLKEEPSLIDLRETCNNATVVGDLHGSLPCLHKILDLAADDLDEPGRAIIFCGDYVDRGGNSLEVLCTLLLLKLAYPSKVVLLRGNHEDHLICDVYGFCEEIQKKYGGPNRSQIIVDKMSQVFAALPLCARTETAFMVHGGIPKADFRLEEIEAITPEMRCKLATIVEPQTEQELLISDMLWSDPSDEDGFAPSPRGTGVEYGPDVAADFMKRHGFRYIFRSHQPAEYGVEAIDCGQHRYVVTVFSTASYPDGEGSNLGAIVNFDNFGNCQPVEFTYDGSNKYEPGNISYDKTLQSFIADNRSRLEKYFASIDNSGGLITKEQWIQTMEHELDLRDVPWVELQPKLAPTTEPDGNLIDWRSYLIRNSNSSFDHDQMSILNENKDKLLRIFQFLDQDGSGGIDRKEFVTGVSILNAKHLPPDQQIKNPDEFFDKIDIDGNGEIDMDEFSQFMAHSTILNNVADALGDDQSQILQQNHEMLLVAFKFLDTDGSGSIDMEEFRVGIDLLNKRLPQDSQLKDSDELFRLLDIDGSGEIDLDEFNQIFHSM